MFIFGPLLLLVIGGIISHHQARVALNEVEQAIFIEWFGADETPHHYALIWEENGLVGLELLDQDQVDVVLVFPEFNGFGEGAQTDIETLLTGGFSTTDASRLDPERFLRAISRIDRILGVDIQRAWNDLLGSN